jgi:CRP-like cAMP-binding protein
VTTTETTAALRARLEAVPLFAHCAPADLAIVAQRSEIRDVAAGTPIIEAGSLGEEFYVLLSGTATVSRSGATVATLQPGDHFGELALLDPAPRDADVTMRDDGVVSVLSRHNFLLALNAIPGITPALLSFLAKRLREAESTPFAEQL